MEFTSHDLMVFGFYALFLVMVSALCIWAGWRRPSEPDEPWTAPPVNPEDIFLDGCPTGLCPMDTVSNEEPAFDLGTLVTVGEVHGPGEYPPFGLDSDGDQADQYDDELGLIWMYPGVDHLNPETYMARFGAAAYARVVGIELYDAQYGRPSVSDPFHGMETVMCGHCEADGQYCEYCGGYGKVLLSDTHTCPYCKGAGCKRCGDVGRLPRLGLHPSMKPTGTVNTRTHSMKQHMESQDASPRCAEDDDFIAGEQADMEGLLRPTLDNPDTTPGQH